MNENYAELLKRAFDSFGSGDAVNSILGALQLLSRDVDSGNIIETAQKRVGQEVDYPFQDVLSSVPSRPPVGNESAPPQGGDSSSSLMNGLLTPETAPKPSTETDKGVLENAAVAGTAKKNEEAQRAEQEQRDANTAAWRIKTAMEDQYAQSPEQDELNLRRFKDNPLTQMEIQAALSIQQMKSLYMNADNPEIQKKLGLNADGVREYASREADGIRRNAQAAGLNMQGFGADVSLADTNRYLEIAKAQALQGISRGTGKYGRSPDEIYEVNYYKAILQGASPQQAEKIAGREARQYAFDQRNYLSTVLENYGTEGGYINPVGTKILAQMGLAGQEGAALSEFLSKQYGSPKDAQTQVNSLEQLLFAHNLGLEDKQLAGLINAILEKQRHGFDLENIGETGRQNRVTYQSNKGVDEQFDINQENRAHSWDAQQRDSLIGLIRDTVQDPKEAQNLVLQVHGLNPKGLYTSNPRQTQTNGLLTLHGHITKQLEGINSQIHAIINKGIVDSPELQELKQKKQELESELNSIKQTYLKSLGYTFEGSGAKGGSQSGEGYSFMGTNDSAATEEQITKVLDTIYADSGGDWETFRNATERVLFHQKQLPDETVALVRQIMSKYKK